LDVFDYELKEHDIHVHLLTLDPLETVPSVLETLLDLPELEKANRYRLVEDRARFIACRSLLRYLLSKYVNQPAMQLCFEYSFYGKPFLRNADLSFNVSHSHQLGALAFARGSPVGVDVEYMRPRVEIEDLARFCLSLEEQKHVFDTPPGEERTCVFFEYWARKEAWMKADGRGLSLPIQSHTITRSLSGNGFRVAPLDVEETARWRIYPLNVPAGYQGAVGSRIVLNHVNQFEWNISSLSSSLTA
jgi:4'-phosphopantetheinyl transferase